MPAFFNAVGIQLIGQSRRINKASLKKLQYRAGTILKVVATTTGAIAFDARERAILRLA